MASQPSKSRHGSCLCKAVKYEVTGDPVTLRVCHCVNCRKATGSAFMTNAFFMEKNVQIVQGADKVKCYRDNETKDGFPLDRFFCTECGSNLFLRPTRKESQIKIVALGTLNDEVNWFPRMEMFPEQKRAFVHGIEVDRTPKAKL
ncbi:Mss4-like protein [Cyathus striatus]|nr:Mss4-like protein [Cyathus striatus]